MDNQRETKTRARTGCLTCRARHIKCDEAKPECRRCHVSNVECRGYDQKRRIVREHSGPSSSNHRKRDAESDRMEHHGTDSVAQFPTVRQPNGLPLVGLPSNPLPGQRPHDGARQILAYHQYIFRTVSVIAPPAHLWWWRDWICEKAWDLEHLYTAIIAIGTIHRALVLLSGDAQTDKRHGQDTIVVAMRTYTKALEQLASHLEQNTVDSSTVAVVLLLACFECFAGNITAAYRHIRVAGDYFSFLSAMEGNDENNFIRPVATCLKALSRVCRITVPLPRLQLDFDVLEAQMNSTRSDVDLAAAESPSSCTIHLFTSCPCQALEEALDLGSSFPGIEKLIWNPLLAIDTSVSLEAINAFHDKVKTWMNSQTHRFPDLSPENNSPISIAFEMTTLEALHIPPEPLAAASVDVSLVGALCEFYLARIEWTLCFLTNESTLHEFLAYSHCYRAMAWAETASKDSEKGARQKSNRLNCERLNAGFLPILYLIGQMSPRTEWLRWTIGQMKSIGQEGLLDGNALAESLSALLVLEMSNNSDISSLLDHRPPPATRGISVFIPHCQGNGHVAYYVRPGLIDAWRQEHDGSRYYLFGSASWASKAGEASSRPEFTFYNQNDEQQIPLSAEWLQSEVVAQGWYGHSESAGFSFDLALADHRGGGILRRVSNGLDLAS